MANRYAVASGDWSNTATWNGGTLPTSADDVYTNNFNVNVNQNIDVISLRNTATTGITAGGTFTFNTSGVTADISNNVFMNTTTVTSFILITAVTGNVTMNVPNATITPPDTANAIVMNYSGNCDFTITCIKLRGTLNVTNLGGVYCIRKTSSGVLTINANVDGSNSTSGLISSTLSILSGNNVINGNIVGGTGADIGAVTIRISEGNLMVTGNVTGGSGNRGYAIVSTLTTGTITIIGNVTGGGSTGITAILLSSTVNLNITGNVSAGAGVNTRGIDSSTSGIITITGNVIGSATNAIISSNGNLNITGTITGGLANGVSSVVISSIGSLNHIGIAQASAFGSAIACNTPTTSNITCTGPFLRNGYIVAVASQTLRINALYNPYFEFRKSDATNVTYVDQATSNFPIELDVREGTIYASGLYTGTLAVPLPSNVRVGVPTDNTVGTADLTAEDMWNYLTSNTFASGSMGDRMKNVSTVASTGAQIASYSV